MQHILKCLTYKLRHSCCSLNFAYTSLAPGAVGEIQTNECSTGFGKAGTEAAASAKLHRIPYEGIELDKAWLDKRGTNQTSVVIMCEGFSPFESPLALEFYIEGKYAGEASLNISLSSVRDMFRYLNIRTADEYFTQDPDRPAQPGLWDTRLGQPQHFPDSYLLAPGETQKTIIMVHGLDWSETETPAGHSEIFKRLYQAGSNARFIGVSWAADLSRRFGAPIVYANDVIGAFIAAKLLNDSNILPTQFLGTNTTIVAHSLGNMVASSAIQDHGLDVGNYVMLNPAVPSESYDGRAPASDSDRRNMTHYEWKGAADNGSQDYEERVMAAGWSTLFSSSDPRSKVTWDNRFGDVPGGTAKVWQFYSSGEEILRAADGDIPPLVEWSTNGVGSVAIAKERVWVYHEMTKGVLNRLIGVAIPRHRSAGWAFNFRWDNRVEIGKDMHGFPIYGYYGKTPAEAALIPTADLVAQPFFKDFNPDKHPTVPRWYDPDAWIYLPDGDIEIFNRLPYGGNEPNMERLKNHAKLLAEMIPPLSSPAGGARLQLFSLDGDNAQYATDMNEDAFKNETLWPNTRPKKSDIQQRNKHWLHGDYKDAPFLLTHKLYKKIKEVIK